MNEYTKLNTFYFKGSLYQSLIDQNDKYYFLKINNNNYEYVTLKEYIQLLDIFTDNEDIRYINKENIPNNPKNKKIKLIPKILIGATSIIVSLSLLTSINNYKPINSNKDYTNSASYVTQQAIVEVTEVDETEKAIQKYFDEIAKDTEKFQIESYHNSITFINIYDSNGLDTHFNNTKKDVTYDMIRTVISNNTNIPTHMKQVFYDMADNLEKKYPDLDLRIWYQNLKTLKIVECETKFDLSIAAISINAEACYKRNENTIYTLKGYEYVPFTWEYQILTHEIGHTMRLANINEDNKTIKTNFTNSSGNIVIVEETLNSLFTLRLYDENEMDIAYQLQSNMMELMVSSMNNYSYQDYIEHNITYFEDKLNEHNQNDKAIEMLHLMNLQYKDFHDKKIDVQQEQYYPLYDYIAKMYYDANIHKGMSQEEMEEVRDNFIYKLTYDVPEEYNIDIEHINEYFLSYCLEKEYTYNQTK